MTTNISIHLRPGEKLSQEIKDKLTAANKAAKRDFPKYKREIQRIFNTKDIVINQELNYWMGGFVEGEGSVSISAKKNENAKFGIEIDPVFNLTQHVNGIQILYNMLTIFHTGRIRYKSGSNATLVFVIDNRQSLTEKVVPFLLKYASSFGAKKQRYHSFKEALDLFDDKAHLDLDRLCFEILPVWNSMRIQIGQSNETFKNLEEAQEFVRTYSKKE
jgi:hypothetical protein